MSRRKIFELFGSIVIEGTGANKKALSELDKNIKKTNKRLNKMGRDAAKVGKSLTKAVTLPVLAVSAAVVKLTNDTARYADQLLDLEQVTGLSTTNLQGLEAVAVEAGVEFNGLTDTIAKFTSRIPDLQSGTGKASEAMHQLGVDIFDSSGEVKDMNTLFPEMVNKLQDVENVTERNSLSQQIFGRSLKDIAPVLSLSKDRFNELFEGAENLAGFMDTDAITSANNYRIQLEELKREFTGTFRELSTKIIPILQSSFLPLIKDKIIPAVMSFAETIASLMDWFSEHTIIADFVGTFVAMLAVAGPLLMVFVKFLPLIKNTIALYKVLTASQITLNAVMATNPVGLIVTAIGLLIAAGVALYKNWDVVKEKFIDTWDSILYHLKNVASVIAVTYAKMYLGILEGINKVGKYIPGVNKGLDKIIGTLKKGVAAVEAQTEARKALRKEQQLSKKLTKEETEIVKKATAARVESGVVAAEVAEQKKKATLAETESAKKLADDKIKLEKRAAQESHNISKRLAREKAKLINDDLKRHKAVTAQKLAENEWEKTEALRIATEKGVETAALEALFKAQEEVIKAEAKAKELEIKEAEKALEIKEREEKLGTVSNFANSINAIWTASLNKRTIELENEAEKERERINSSTMSEEGKANAIAKIDEELAEKKKKLARENAIREKAMTLMGIALATALAVTKALPIIPLSIAVGALGLVQLGIAAATPLPLAKGGLIRSDGSGTGVVAEVGEGREDEIVLPMKTGAAELANNIMGKIRGVGADISSRAKSRGGEIHNHFHVGTLIANESGIKKFAKKVNKYTIAEQQRTGV